MNANSNPTSSTYTHTQLRIQIGLYNASSYFMFLAGEGNGRETPRSQQRCPCHRSFDPLRDTNGGGGESGLLWMRCELSRASIHTHR